MSTCVCGRMPCECSYDDGPVVPRWEISAVDWSSRDLMDRDTPVELDPGWEPFAYDADRGRTLVRRRANPE